ncbi:P-loop containing nucleoside triphosphate hydrolase protein, partial [Rhizoctonia solani]
NKKFVYEFSEPVKVALSFSELKLKDHLLQSLNRCNLRSPYGLQQCVILPITNGRNVIAQAPPETGKTTAMILSVLQLTDTSKKGIQALIICSTDGEASQVQSMTTSLGYQCYKPSNSQSVRDDLGQLSEGHNFSILVGTPDRVLLLSRQGILSTLGVRILALDDLDTSTDNAVPQMLLDLYQYLPRSIQTLIIGSGLLNKPHEGLIPFINKPLYITLGRHNRVSGGITHAFIIVPSNQEPTFFNQLLNNGTTPVRGAVLCDTFSEVRSLPRSRWACLIASSRLITSDTN